MTPLKRSQRGFASAAVLALLVALGAAQTKVRIDGIEPEAGPVTGATRVLVRGGPFIGMADTYPHPRCRFGHDDMVVQATYVPCTTNPRKQFEKEAHHAEKNDTCLQCDDVPENLKPEIIPFTISLNGNFTDGENSVSYRFYPVPQVFAIGPRYGPKDGETWVQVWGQNFLNFDQNTQCHFGSKTATETKFINSNYMLCQAPTSDVVQKPIPFTVSLNNQQNTKNDINYWYYNWPTISELIPDRGPDSGNTKVLVKGSNFNPFVDEPIDNLNDTFLNFEGLGKVPVQVVNSTKLYVFSPPSYVLRSSRVELTLNNQQYTDDGNIFYYYKPPYVFDINPREGPVQGNTTVFAIGSNFRDTGKIRCKFNETIVNGTFVSTSTIKCVSPPSLKPGFVPLSVALEQELWSSSSASTEFLYYETPVVESITPICGPDYGYTQITVKGKNFIDMGLNKAKCVFNKTIWTNATIMEEDIIKCDSPSILNNQGFNIYAGQGVIHYLVEVTINNRDIAGPAQKFTYYQDPLINSITPNLGPISGGTVSQIAGSGFNQEGACNVTVRYAYFEQTPINYTDTEMHTSSPKVKTPVPSDVTVAIALNGQQFSRDFVIHKHDVENTFRYYQAPYVTFYTPKAGPDTGATTMKIFGKGFQPFRREDGSVEPMPVYARMIDEKTLSPLSSWDECTSVNDERLTYITPRMPAGTKAILQISLNKVDPTDIIPLNSTYSYLVYSSPNIDYITPEIGPVKSDTQQYIDAVGTNFVCPDAPTCADLYCRFGTAPNTILTKGYYKSETQIKCKVPKYTKPDVLVVELTLNGQDFTVNGKTYGFFDPYVIRVSPRLINVNGNTKVRIIGYGFVNSTEVQAKFDDVNNTITCNGAPCIKDAVFIDKNTIETSTFHQTTMIYQDPGENVGLNPFPVEVSVYGGTFTENKITIQYYVDPEYHQIDPNIGPANLNNYVMIDTDFKFKQNSRQFFEKHGNFTCRYKSIDGKQVRYTNATMMHVPITSNGTVPNTIACPAPNWDLGDRLNETVLVDVSINGQDFSGNFTYTFYQNLVLYRSVPMAGPNEGNTRVRLIGTGFKSRDFFVKWGILSSDLIKKEHVYNFASFEALVEKSESFRAYLYEAANIPKKDLPMNDNTTYYSTFASTPKLPNWYKTQGGPFYVSLGVNSTNMGTSNHITLATNPAYVEFYYYKQPVIKLVTPHGGVSRGGTPIVIVGAWFQYKPEYGVVPHCKIGDYVSRGIFDSTVRIICPAPANSRTNVEFPIEVSLNGVDYTSAGFKFHYYDEPTMDFIDPEMGPEAGGTQIYIHGKNFSNVSDAAEFNCKFTPVHLPIPPKVIPARYYNSSVIMCPSPGGWGQGDEMTIQVTFNGMDYDQNNFIFNFFNIIKAFPRSGPSDGSGGDIIITGQGFKNTSKVSCLLDGREYKPTSITLNEIRCPMIKAKKGATFFGNVDFKVSVNGRDWHNFNGGFQYYEQPRVIDMYPKQGPNVGNGIINFYGEKFRDDYALAELGCHVGNAVGKGVLVSDSQIRCVVEEMDLQFDEEGTWPAGVALNSYSWTPSFNSTDYSPYGIIQIQPNAGPVGATNDIVVIGRGFEQTQSARCRFGIPANYAIVEAQVLSYEKLVCKAPSDYRLPPTGSYPHSIPFSIAFNADEFEPWTESVHRYRLYEQPTLNSAEPSQVDMGQVIEVLVTCDTNSEFFDPPPVAPNDPSFGIRCKFGRFGTSIGIFHNSTTIKCLTPITDEDPSNVYKETVQLAIAMNSVDFEEDVTSVDFTFVGTATYMVFWPYLISLLLIGLLVFALVLCCQAIFARMSARDARVTRGAEPFVVKDATGQFVPRGIPQSLMRAASSEDPSSGKPSF